MPNKYIIERNVPGADKLGADEIAAISAKSNGVLHELGTDIQWVQSFVTSDKLYCVYIAKSADLIREHARLGGFPVDAVREVRFTIDPTSAGSK